MPHVELSRHFPHPRSVVFARYTDHESWGDWTGMGRVRLVREGTPHRNGVGAVRAFGGLPLREEVTGFEEPTRMLYRVSAGGFPVTDHRGEVVFDEAGNGTRVTWRVRFRSRLPGTGLLLERGLHALFRRILSALAKDLDRRPAANGVGARA